MVENLCLLLNKSSFLSHDLPLSLSAALLSVSRMLLVLSEEGLYCLACCSVHILNQRGNGALQETAVSHTQLPIYCNH